MDFLGLAASCAPDVHPVTLSRVVTVESSNNPYAIGVVGGRLIRQPASREEAVATARRLISLGRNISVGLGQVNIGNWAASGLTVETAFDPCLNLRAAAKILTDCYRRASARGTLDEQVALRDAFSCYYSGNFMTGYTDGYVQRIVPRTATGQRPATSVLKSTDVPRAKDRDSALLF